MQTILETFKAAGAFSFLQLFGMFLSLIWCLVPAVLLGMRWKVPPLVSTLPLFLFPLVASMGASWSWSNLQSASRAAPEERAMAISYGMAQTLAHPELLLLAIPASMILGVGGLIAGFRPPRAWLAPAGVFLSGGLLACLPMIGALSLLADVHLAGLSTWESVPLALLRTVLYLAGLIPLTLSAANAHPHGNGPEGGTTAAIAWIGFVGAVELSTGAIHWGGLFSMLAALPDEKRAATLRTIITVASTQVTFRWFALLLAGVPALMSVLREGPELTEKEILTSSVNPSPWRTLGRFLALGVWLAWMLALWSCTPVPALELALKLMR